MKARYAALTAGEDGTCQGSNHPGFEPALNPRLLGQEGKWLRSIKQIKKMKKSLSILIDQLGLD